jgi:two-component system sensor histidine kinase UhpB
VYRVAQEALTNVARHSASARAELALECRDGRLILTVRDYGFGLPHNKPAGAGIRGMRERAALIGATLEVHSNEAGQGTEVRLAVPVEAQA